MDEQNINHYLKINKLICGIHGYWPVNNNASKSTVNSNVLRIVISFLLVNNMFIPEIMAVVKFRNDVFVMTRVGCVTTTLAQIVFKMIYLVKRRKLVNKLHQDIISFWDRTKDPVEKKILELYARKAQIFTTFFFITGISVVIIFEIKGLVAWYQHDRLHKDVEKALPFEVWYGFEIQDSTYFGLLFLIQIGSANTCNDMNIGLDAACMTMILHVCAQFKVLRNRFEKISRRTDHDFTPNEVERFQVDLKHAIRLHSTVLSTVRDMNIFVQPVIFVQLVTSSLVICLTGFAIIVTGTNAIDLLRFSIYLNCMTLQLVVWCWPGEVLSQESLSIRDVFFYQCELKKLPNCLQRDILFVVVRASKPSVIKTLGSESIRIAKLTEIFRSAASFFTLLRRVYQT